MQINNPLQMNDWEMKKFLKVILAVQFAMWGSIGLDAIGMQIPIVRQLIGLIYLTFVPGIIILRILKLHELGNIETLLYSVGLSIATLMFTGLFMNTLYPIFGISGPISITPLIITMSIIVLVLCIVCYVVDKDFSAPSCIEIKKALSAPVMFLCLVPFVSIFGTYLVNFYHNNILLMFLIVMIALIVILIGFDKFIPKNLYPLAVFVIAISLLFYRSLLSIYISGFDIHAEYYLANLVKIADYWKTTDYGMLNALLSITMFAPISSEIYGMSLTWIFKIIYPLLYSLVPLGLYRVFEKQTDDKIAFLSSFFFMSVYQFYTDMPVIPRQLLASLPLVLLILLMIDKNMDKVNRSFLFIVFGASLVVSHYGLSYIYMFILILVWSIRVLGENSGMQKLINIFHSKISRYNSEKLACSPISSNRESKVITLTFVLFFAVFTLTWYMYSSSYPAFSTLVQFGNQITSIITSDFLNPKSSEGLTIMTSQVKPSLLNKVNSIINYLNQVFIIIGVIILLKRSAWKFNKYYVIFSMISLFIVFVNIALPFYAAWVNIQRLYHIALIFLALSCVIGAITVVIMIGRMIKASWTKESNIKSLKILSVYFVMFFMFQIGFIWQVTEENYTGSVSLSQETIKKYGNPETKAAFYSAITPEQEVFSAEWLYRNMYSGEKVYATYDDIRVHALTSYGMVPVKDVLALTKSTKIIQKDAYVYLQYLNVIEGLNFEEKSKIYSNGGSEIYK